jgi:hypothetical protein
MDANGNANERERKKDRRTADGPAVARGYGGQAADLRGWIHCGALPRLRGRRAKPKSNGGMAENDQSPIASLGFASLMIVSLRL